MFTEIVEAAAAAPGQDTELNVTAADLNGQINPDGTMMWNISVEMTIAAPGASAIDAVVTGRSEYDWTEHGSSITVTQTGMTQEGYFNLGADRFPIASPPAAAGATATYGVTCGNDTVRFELLQNLGAGTIDAFPTVALERTG